MFNKTKLDAEESFFIYVKDSNTNRVTRIAFPSDIQIGTNGNPKELHLLGALSLSTNEYTATSKVNSLKLSDHDTIVNVKNVGTPSNNEIIVLLPPTPRDGQLHCIKDVDGISSTYEIKIRSSVTNTLIDNSSELSLTNDFDSAILYWRDTHWHVLMKTSSGSSGSGAPTNATYLTLSSNATLTNERTLSLSGSNISFTDNGPNSTAQLNLTSILGGGAGTFTNATVTADAFGRITAISAGSSSVGAPSDAQYVVITNNATLTQERALAVGLGLILADAGANNSVTLSVNNGVVATLTGSTFSGPVIADGGLTGSLQRTSAGLSYLVAGSNIIVTSQSNGQVIISSTATGSFSGGSGADVSASYIVVGNTASLPNERALTAGYGLALLDGGANGNLIISFQGSLSASGGGSGADVSASYITIGNTGSLPNERALVAGYGLTLLDGGAGENVIISFAGSLSSSGGSTQAIQSSSAFISNLSSFETVGNLPEARDLNEVFIAQDKIWIIGGRVETASSNPTNHILTASCMNPTLWGSSSISFPVGIRSFFHWIVDDKAYIAGGVTSSVGGNGVSALIYSASLNNFNTWSSTGRFLPEPLSAGQPQSLFISNNKIWLLGCISSAGNETLLIYTASVSDPLTWGSSNKFFPQERTNMGVYVADDYAYAIGGSNAGIAFAPDSNIYIANKNDLTKWKVMSSSFPIALTSVGTSVINNQVYVVGGRDNSGIPLDTIYSAPISNPTHFKLIDYLPTPVATPKFAYISGSAYSFGGLGVGSVLTNVIIKSSIASTGTYLGAPNNNFGAIPVTLVPGGTQSTLRRSERIGINEWYTNLGTESLGYTPNTSFVDTPVFLGSAYSGYTTGAINFNQTSSWTPILSATQGHFQDLISRTITRNNSTFTINESGSYNFHASFNTYGSDAYITLRLSGSDGTTLQRSTYRSTPIDQNPAMLDGIFDAQPDSVWSLEYITSGSVFPWTSSNPLPSGENMWTGEVSIYRVQSDTNTSTSSTQFITHTSEPITLSLNYINLVSGSTILSATLPAGSAGSTCTVKKLASTGSLCVYTFDSNGIDNQRYFPLRGMSDSVTFKHDGTRWHSIDKMNLSPPEFSGSQLIGWWDWRTGVGLNSSQRVEWWDAVYSRRGPTGIRLKSEFVTSSITLQKQGLFFDGTSKSVLSGVIGNWNGITVCARATIENNAYLLSQNRYLLFIAGQPVGVPGIAGTGTSACFSYIQFQNSEYPILYTVDNAINSVFTDFFAEGVGNFPKNLKTTLAASLNGTNGNREFIWWRNHVFNRLVETGTVTSACTGSVNSTITVGGIYNPSAITEWKGSLSQLLIYDRALTDSDLETVTMFLNDIDR